MKKQDFFKFFLVLIGIFIFLFLFSFDIQAKELTQEEIDTYIQLSESDARSILRSLPQYLTDKWIDSVVSVAIAEEEGIVMIIRKAIRGKMMDYFLREGPKELGKEAMKMAFLIGRLALTSDISALFAEFEKMTIKESLKYLGQWLKENETKIAFGNIDFSYNTLAKKKEKHRFQYLILYSSETKEAVIKIYSANPISPPASQGSWGAISGTGWNYSQEQAKGKKIPSFILSIKGRMSREQGGYWLGKITHSYSWDYQPKIDIEFPDFVPSFDFHKKGFFERTGDKIKAFFGKIGNSFSGLFGASIVQPSFDDFGFDESHPDNNGEWLGEIIKKLLEQIRIFRQFLSDLEYEQLEKEAGDIRTEEDFNALLKKLEKAQAQIEEMGQFSEDSSEEEQEEELPETQEVEVTDGELAEFDLVINEVCAGLDNSKNEFIELYNPNDFSVSLDNDNFQLKLVSSSNESTNKRVTWNNNVIPAKGYFLLIAGELVFNGETLQSDAVFSSQLSSVSGVIISDKEGNILDKVGWGKIDQLPPDLAVENQGKTLENGLKTGQSLERKNHFDTDDNSSDFFLNQSPSPTNSKKEERIYSETDSSDDSTGDESSSADSNGSTGGAGSDTVGTIFCSQEDLGSPVHFPVIFNEIAWMGSNNSANDEWIELKNISTSTVELSGWQILDKAGQIKIVFGDNDSIIANGFYLLERTDDDSVPGISADKIYSGSLGNSDESLRLFNKNCELIDQVTADPDWPAGSNEEKRTMEKGDDLSWHTYVGDGIGGIMGTPKAENSEGSSLELNGNRDNQEEEEEEEDEEEDNGEGEEQVTSTTGLLITEVMAVGNQEFVEIYNPLAQEISLDGFYLSYFSEVRDWNEPYINKQFPTSTIASQEYYLIGFGDYEGEPDPDWSPDTRHLSDNSGSIAIFSCNLKDSEGNPKTIEQAMACKIDALGWGEPIVKEGQVADPAQESKSLARILAADQEGYLKYVDADDNSADFEEQEPSPKSKNFSSFSDLDDDGIIDSYDPLTIVSMDRELEPGEHLFKDLLITNKANLLLKGDPNLEGFKGVKILADNLTVETGCSLNSDKQGYLEPIVLERNFFSPQTLGLGGPENPRNLTCFARPGGIGGGAIILEITNTLDLQGRISAQGENSSPSPSWGCGPTRAGEGGSIHITINILKGNGDIFADGGDGDKSWVLGKGGQIAVYYQDKSAFVGKIHSFGGEKIGDYASPGTVYLKNNLEKKLIIEAQDLAGIFWLSKDLAGIGAIEINNVTINATTSINFEAQDFIMESALLKGPDQEFLNFQVSNFSLINSEIRANINASAQNINLDITSLFSANEKGYPSDTGPGAGEKTGGGSYGGAGGNNATTTIYGSLTEPIDFGSGAGGNSRRPCCLAGPGGAGGGVVILNIGNKLKLEGIISANGKDGRPSPQESCRPTPSYGCGATAGGSGGSVYIRSYVLEGAGSIRANGGGTCFYAGAGGGGRVAIYGDRTSFNGIIESLGGENPIGSEVYAGEDGTIYLSP